MKRFTPDEIAYRQGRRAFVFGKDLDANPYKRDRWEQRVAWRYGWYDKKAEIQRHAEAAWAAGHSRTSNPYGEGNQCARLWLKEWTDRQNMQLLFAGVIL